MKMYYVVNARLPNKKAYGIQIAKMCEAFIEAGIDLTLVIPSTRAARSSGLKEFYGLRVDIPTVILPGFDWYAAGPVPFAFSTVSFACMSSAYLLRKRLLGEKAAVYTIDMDAQSFAALPFAGFPVISEMHAGKRAGIFLRYFFRRAAAVIPTNQETKKELQEQFDVGDERFLVEPNGVDPAMFSNVPSRSEAREKLGLPQDARIALYTGRFFGWKGLDILSTAAGTATEIEWYVVGGSPEEFRAASGTNVLPAHLHVSGECAFQDVPVWLAAADALLILGTQQNEESFRYTSPMKIFEYMAAGRIVVAAKTPALVSIIPADAAQFYYAR